MSQASVISVNPAQSTIGDLNPDATARILRSRMIERSIDNPSFKKVLNAAFALGGSRGISNGVSLLLLRSLAGILLLLSGVSAAIGGVIPFGEVLESVQFVASPLAILQIAAGCALCLGMLTRLVLSGIAAAAAAMFFAGLSSGAFLQPEAMLTVVSLVFAITGAGTHSVDALLRSSIFRVHCTRVRRKAERRLSYEAFRYQQF